MKAGLNGFSSPKNHLNELIDLRIILCFLMVLSITLLEESKLLAP